VDQVLWQLLIGRDSTNSELKHSPFAQYDKTLLFRYFFVKSI